MDRCLQLAALGIGSVAPNPMVGALLVHQYRIIGEGYHKKYGEAHAEPNCIASVKEEDKNLISRSTLYISLEPCVHFGKTPPCVDLILKHKIPNVIIGCRDPFEEVNGRGIEKLKNAGVEVEVGILERDCTELNKRFFTFHQKNRPYVILKWAQAANGTIGRENGERVFITNEFTNRLVHKWRSEEPAILIGTNTALTDNPELTTRLWEGNDPTRLVIDLGLRLPSTLKIFNAKSKTIVFNKIKQEEKDNILFYKVPGQGSLVEQVVHALYDLKIQSIIVEGGTRLLQSFIDEGIWDEARIITNSDLVIEKGVYAPEFTLGKKIAEQQLLNDKIEIFKPQR